MSDAGTTADSSELEALFDSISGEFSNTTQKTPNPHEKNPAANEASSEGDAEWPGQDKIFNQAGQMARHLHDTLGALGYDKLIAKTVTVMPDAADRLSYIANLTEQAACKVLNATDVANPLQDALESTAAALDAEWDALYANKMSTEEFRQLAAKTREFLKTELPRQTSATKAQLMEIMMAQDFQDLTGQVIKKIVALAQDMEAHLMTVLIDTMPGEKRTESVNSLLNGPVINAEGRTDIVRDQQQVDDLLGSLGF